MKLKFAKAAGKTRIPKSEFRKNTQTRSRTRQRLERPPPQFLKYSSVAALPCAFGFRFSNLFRISDFGIRISSGSLQKTKSFKTFVPLVFGLFLAAASLAQDIAITPTKRIDLFNGKDLTGWKFTARGDAPAAETWSVTNGVIHCIGQPFGYARTDSFYRDYKLTVEWRFVKIAPKADNSGIFLHINPPDKVWPTCIEVQGQHGKQGDLRMNGGATATGHDTAETKNCDAQAPSNEKPVGEWNTLEVECAGDGIKLRTNGKLINQISGCSVSSGAVGIQSEGGEIEVRKMFLEPIKR